MATYDFTLTNAASYADSGIPASKDVNLRNRHTYLAEYRVQATQPADNAPGMPLDYREMHPIKIPAGEKLWVRLLAAGAGSYPMVAIDG